MLPGRGGPKEVDRKWYVSKKLSISQRTIGNRNTPRFGGVIGLRSHLQSRQRQKGVVLVPEKLT